MEINESIIELQKGKPANVTYPSDLRNGVLGVIGSWKAFCELPRETKKKFVYTEDHGILDGSGYELKLQPGQTLDLKENFHVTLKEVQRLAELAKEAGISETVQFIHDAERLINLATPIIQGFAEGLGETLRIPSLAAEVMEGRNSWVFRYIHYFGDRNIGDQTAAPHPDKSAFTLHLFESEAGLEYMSLDKLWLPMPVSKGETAIIPGMQLQFVSRNEIKALYHRVVATQESAKRGRYSLVCFVPLIHTHADNKSDRRRLQDYEPGFNYDMPFDKFQGFFV